jgi:fibronectin-binding autotransporter adhesin
MALQGNNAEGGSNTTVVSVGNSGGSSGTAFAQVSTGGGTLTYTSVNPLEGSLSYRFTGAAVQQFFDQSDLVGASASMTGLAMFSFTALPTATHLLCQFRSSGAQLGDISVSSAGMIRCTAGSTVGGSGSNMAVNTPYYLQWYGTGYGTASTALTVNVLDAAGAPVSSVSASGTTSAQVLLGRWGKPSASGGAAVFSDFRIEPLAFNVGSSTPIPVPGSDFSGSVALAGGGTLTYSSTITTSGSAALAGAGTLAAAGSPSAGGALSLSGAGTLAATGRPGAAGTLSTSGAGTLTGAGTLAVSGGLTASGTGTLGRTGVPTATGTLSTAGSGTLTPSGTPVTSGTLALSGTGTLALSGTGSSDGGGSINLAGAGTLTGTGTPSVSGTLALGGAGSLGSVGVPATSGTRALSGAGTLSLSGAPGGFAGSVSLSGSGALSGAGTLAVAGALGLSGIGALSLFGQPAGALTGALALSGEGALASTARVGTSGGLQLGGIGYFAKAPGVQVGFTPSNEMVAVAWLKSAVPYLGNRVATELPSDNSSWSASGFTTVATTGGTPNTEVPVNEPVMSIDSWGVTPSSGRPPWNLAAQPAEAIKAAAVDHGMIPRILTMPTGFNLVRVFCVIPLSEPRRINGDAAAYAHYQQDLEIRWVKT